MVPDLLVSKSFYEEEDRLYETALRVLPQMVAGTDVTCMASKWNAGISLYERIPVRREKDLKELLEEHQTRIIRNACLHPLDLDAQGPFGTFTIAISPSDIPCIWGESKIRDAHYPVPDPVIAGLADRLGCCIASGVIDSYDRSQALASEALPFETAESIVSYFFHSYLHGAYSSSARLDTAATPADCSPFRHQTTLPQEPLQRAVRYLTHRLQRFAEGLPENGVFRSHNQGSLYWLLATHCRTFSEESMREQGSVFYDALASIGVKRDTFDALQNEAHRKNA